MPLLTGTIRRQQKGNFMATPIEAMRAAIKAAEEKGKVGKGGVVVAEAGNGPPAFSLLKVVSDAVDDLYKRIEILEKRAYEADINRPMPEL
jgi:hypothetical protein